MTEPYYQDERVTLYHGDCLELDEWRTADVLVTDPPYGISWKQGSYLGTGSRTPNLHGGIANDADTTTRDEVLQAWGGDRPSVVFGSFRAPFPAGVVQTLIWKKGSDSGVLGTLTGYRNDTELIFLRGTHPRRTASRSSILQSSGGMDRYRNAHPHAKPPLILEQLIAWLPGVVADPFAGSGSALVAARNLGRKAIGVEIEERYCELIACRLSQGCLDFREGA